MNDARENAAQKLHNGRRALASAGTNPDLLSVAFIKLHSALEDRLRELLANRLPRQRLDIYDFNNFKWPNILEYSRQYLGMSQADSDFIYKANSLRNPIAHGGDFTWNRDAMLKYEQMILQLWATGSRTGTSYRPATGAASPRLRTGTAYPSGTRSGPTPPPRASTTYRPAARPSPAPTPHVTTTYSPATQTEKPWYRTTGFYVLSFFFLGPVWAGLILTDGNQGCLVKGFAVFTIVMGVIIGFGLCMTLTGTLFLGEPTMLVLPLAAC